MTALLILKCIGIHDVLNINQHAYIVINQTVQLFPQSTYIMSRCYNYYFFYYYDNYGNIADDDANSRKLQRQTIYVLKHIYKYIYIYGTLIS